jgi:hypothetical protein
VAERTAREIRTDGQFRKFCELIDRADLLEDPQVRARGMKISMEKSR